MSEGPSGSRLFYFGTKEEVRLGDRVVMRRFLRRAAHGTVCYIPGISPKHGEMEYEDIRQWAIRLDDGTVVVWGYWPESGQPDKRVSLVSRGAGGELLPSEELG